MFAAQFEYKRFGCRRDRERVIMKGLGHLCHVILLWRKNALFLRWHDLSLILHTFIPYVPKCHLWLKIKNCEQIALFVVTLFPIPLHIDTIFDKCENQQLCVIFFIFQLTWLMIQLLENSFVESAKTPPNSQMNITLRKVFNTGGTTSQWDRRSTTGGAKSTTWDLPGLDRCSL